MLSENREESESLGWSSPTCCFSPLKGILCHSSVGKEIVPGPAQRQAEKGDLGNLGQGSLHADQKY